MRGKSRKRLARRFLEADRHVDLLEDGWPLSVESRAIIDGAQPLDLRGGELGRGDHRHVDLVAASRDDATAVLFPRAAYARGGVDHADVEEPVLERPGDRRLVAHGAHILLAHVDLVVAQHRVGRPPHVGVLVGREDRLALDVGDGPDGRSLHHDEERLVGLLGRDHRLVAVVAHRLGRDVVGTREEQPVRWFFRFSFSRSRPRALTMLPSRAAPFRPLRRAPGT